MFFESFGFHGIIPYMKYTLTLPTMETVEIYYNPKVYDPHYTQSDALVITDALIRKSQLNNLRVLDLGCGSGVLGLGLKYLHPKLEVTLSDISAEAIKVSKKNARDLKLEGVTFKKTDMLDDLDEYDIILANLPSMTKEQIANSQQPLRTIKDEALRLYKQLFDTDKTSLIVHEIQALRNKELQLIATGRGWEEIMKTDYGFAWLKKDKGIIQTL